MWNYQKQLQYPVNIKNPNPAAAKVIITQLGGPDGELSAATRYLSQRYVQPYKKAKAILTDIGMEEGAGRRKRKRKLQTGAVRQLLCMQLRGKERCYSASKRGVTLRLPERWCSS